MNRPFRAGVMHGTVLAGQVDEPDTRTLGDELLLAVAVPFRSEPRAREGDGRAVRREDRFVGAVRAWQRAKLASVRSGHV